jgi:hypothetical protein
MAREGRGGEGREGGREGEREGGFSAFQSLMVGKDGKGRDVGKGETRRNQEKDKN